MVHGYKEKPKVKPKKAFRFQTFAVIRNYDGKVFVARILSDKRLTGKGTKYGDLKNALKFQREGEKVEVYRLDKSWTDAQALDVGDIKKLIKSKAPRPFSFSGAVALWELRRRRGEEAITPAFAPIGESERMITKKAVPRRRKRI